MAQTIVQIQKHPGTPWGFRLQGGRDFSSELSVKKIQPGSPVEGHLRAGDRIVGIGNQQTKNMTHMQANGLIKSAGNMLQLSIIRGPSTDFSNIKPTGPVKFSPWKYNQQQQQQNHY